MTRGRLSLTAALLALAIGLVAVRMARSEAPAPQAAARPSELALLVFEAESGPLTAVIGAGGSVAPAVLVLPGPVAITVPGQGDSTIGESSLLPGRQAATAAANLLGVWVPHYANIGPGKLETLVDRAGGIEVGGSLLSGAEAVAAVEAAGDGRDEVWRSTLEAVFAAVSWQAVDLPRSDSPTDVAELLNAATDAVVGVLPGEAVPGGVIRTDPAAIRSLLTSAFGVPDREVLPLIVLNGSGEPGVGERVAEHVIPGGFRVVVSENASSFDHDTTAIVVASEQDRALGERVRDLLGVGEVQVAGPASGLADVTVVVGKDFSA